MFNNLKEFKGIPNSLFNNKLPPLDKVVEIELVSISSKVVPCKKEASSDFRCVLELNGISDNKDYKIPIDIMLIGPRDAGPEAPFSEENNAHRIAYYIGKLAEQMSEEAYESLLDLSAVDERDMLDKLEDLCASEFIGKSMKVLRRSKWSVTDLDYEKDEYGNIRYDIIIDLNIIDDFNINDFKEE